MTDKTHPFPEKTCCCGTKFWPRRRSATHCANPCLARTCTLCDSGSGAKAAGRERVTPADKVAAAQKEALVEAQEYVRKTKPLPPVPDRVRALKAEDMGFTTPQHAVACFSDLHYGGKVDPAVTGGIGGYNVEIARNRLAMWRDGVLRFTQMMQALMPIPELHVLALGDDMEGNGHMFGSQALQMDGSIYSQFMGFTESVSEVLVQLLERYEKIHIYKVFGNHGRIAARAKDNYDPDNVELMAWQVIKERCMAVAPDRFTFDISDSFFMLLDIQGWSFYIRHGDGVNLHSTYTGITHNKLAMNSIVGETINYMVMGHHHTASEREEEIDGTAISNGCFVGPSLLALRMRQPRANRPSQELFFVHPTHGVTHRHRLYLADRAEVRRVKKVKRS